MEKMVKIFGLSSGRTIVAEEVKEGTASHITKNPCYVEMLPGQKPQEVNVRFSPVPTLAKNFQGLMDKFILKKEHTLFSDEIDQEFVDAYNQFIVKLRAQMAGIALPTDQQPLVRSFGRSIDGKQGCQI